MQYDIFISYSRRDSLEVNHLIDLLRREIPGIKIWYDIEGIETAEEFRNKIIGALDQSKVVLFACSDNSLGSQYCEKEVMYAKNVGKTVIPYLLPGVKLKGWLLFEYGNINCVHSTHSEEVNRMIKDLRRWSGLNSGSIADSPNPNNQTSNSLESELCFDPSTGEFKQNTKLNGHEYVDLALPSGIKWASCNIGALKPEESGGYFAWGEINPKSSYTQDNCLTFGKSNLWLQNNGYIGNDNNLTALHDAARQNWGGTWRMPTEAEILELGKYTTSEWVNCNGVKGRLFKSIRNNNSIFLPACGWKTADSIKGNNLFGYYWSGEVDKNNPEMAIGFYFTMSMIQCKAFERSWGRLIRPVSN